MKKLSIILIALLGSVANAQTFKVPSQVVGFNNEGVTVYGSQCATVQAQYIEYFKPTASQLKDYKEGIREGWEFDSEGKAFTSELVAPSVFGADSQAQAELAKTAIKDGGYLEFNSDSKTCTFAIKTNKGSK